MKHFALLALLMLIFGCGGGGDNAPTVQPPGSLPSGIVGEWQSEPSGSWPTYAEIIKDGETYVAYFEHFYTPEVFVVGYFESDDESPTKTFRMVSGEQNINLHEILITTVDGTRDLATYQVFVLSKIGTPGLSHGAPLVRIIRP